MYASPTCPICLVVALKCGHCICEEDFRKMGGYLASDKDKVIDENEIMKMTNRSIGCTCCCVAIVPSGVNA